MRIGFTLPQFGPASAKPGDLARFARTAEDLGADSLWVGDRLLSPLEPKIGYGRTGPGPFPPEFSAVLDPFTALTVAATATSRVRLGSNVLNTPWYSPLLLARTLTSIDVISGGRLAPGFGIGWSPDEFGAVGVPYGERGARLDETLDILETAWGKEVVAHDSPQWTVPSSRIDLKPTQSPRPPIYIGGFAPAALRRVGRRGDGWLATGVLPGRLDPESYPEPLSVIRRAAADAGRDPAAIEVILRLNPLKGVEITDIADGVLAVRDKIGLDEVLIELMYLEPDIDRSLDVVATLLPLLR